MAEIAMLIGGIALAGGCVWLGFKSGYKLGEQDGWIECFKSVKHARQRDYIDRWIESAGNAGDPLLEVPHV